MHNDIALPSGYTLQEYRIESTLGVGGFGLTYLATDSNLNMQVAIKEYLPGELAMRCEDQSIRSKSDHTLEKFNWGRSRFLDESRTLASFRHPNIVRVMRFFEANQTAYMVMEFVAGKPLNEWVRSRRPLNPQFLSEMSLALLGGIDVIHQSGYLHRDIKPGNIFLRDDGTPVLLDFGSARAATADTERTAIVSPGYAPLEQYHSHGNQGPWTDLYAWGAVMYWLVTGIKPLDATARVPDDKLQPAVQAAAAGHYGRPLLEAIDWALSPSEKRRPQSVSELRQLVESNQHLSNADAPTVVIGRTQLPDVPTLQMNRTTVITGFDPAALKALAADLAAHLGPVASIVVKSAAKKSAGLEALVRTLAEDIADPVARTDFLKKHAPAVHNAGPGDRSRPSSRSEILPTGLYPSRATFDPALLAKAEGELAQYIGAVAKAIVRRAAGKAHSEHELYSLLANEIDDANGKKAFLRKAMSVSGRV